MKLRYVRLICLIMREHKSKIFIPQPQTRCALLAAHATAACRLMLYN